MGFTLLRFPVRVEWSFFIMVAILGWRSDNLSYTLLWVVICFFSVLVHELGHATIGRTFGARPSIVLYWGGGLTYVDSRASLRPAQTMLISLAGPVFGFALGAVAYFSRPLLASVHSPYFNTAFWYVLWINVGWGLINLLPVLPLDGGQIMESFVTRPNRAQWVSLITAILAALVALWGGYFGLVIFFAWLAYMGFESLRIRGLFKRVP